MVRRLTPSNLAASVSDRPKDFRHFEKSAPLIGNCSSAIPRGVELERSRRPPFVSIGQATPMPSSNISSFAKVSASSISGAKCSLRAINPVRARNICAAITGKAYGQSSAAGWTHFRHEWEYLRSFRPPLELIPQLQQLRLILLNPAPGFCQDPVWCVPGDQFAVCEANLRREVAPRNVHVRRPERTSGA